MEGTIQELMKGTEQLIRKPVGCGEQTMMYLAPMVYAMKYLIQTDQDTPEIETKGFDLIRGGTYTYCIYLFCIFFLYSKIIVKCLLLIY
jgi:hypothetical protein